MRRKEIHQESKRRLENIDVVNGKSEFQISLALFHSFVMKIQIK